MTTKIRDLMIADDILSVVYEEVRDIKASTERSPADIIKLEKLSKTYQIIMASHRENVKAGLFGQLSEEELNDTADDTDEDGEDAEEL